MMNKAISAVLTLGVVLAQGGSAHAACDGERDPVVSQCSDESTAGRTDNDGFRVITDLARGSSAFGTAFDDSGDEIDECETVDRVQGLGNRSDGAEITCPINVAEVQVAVD